VKNKFTIVNKEDNGMNHTTIGSENGGTITDVTAFKKEKKKTILERFSIGPTVTAGYDVCHKEWGVMAGVGITLNLE
jgi:hypothetical protein